MWGIGAAYNGLGQLAVCARMDYLRALGCFTESVRVLEGSPYRSLYYVAMSNLALTYCCLLYTSTVRMVFMVVSSSFMPQMYLIGCNYANKFPENKGPARIIPVGPRRL